MWLLAKYGRLPTPDEKSVRTVLRNWVCALGHLSFLLDEKENGQGNSPVAVIDGSRLDRAPDVQERETLVRIKHPRCRPVNYAASNPMIAPIDQT